MSKFLWTTSVKRGDHGASIYWRAQSRLQSDPIASMLAEHTINGLADAFYTGLVDEEGKARFSPSALIPYALGIIERSPLSIMGDDAKKHLAKVLKSAIIVEDQ